MSRTRGLCWQHLYPLEDRSIWSIWRNDNSGGKVKIRGQGPVPLSHFHHKFPAPTQYKFIYSFTLSLTDFTAWQYAVNAIDVEGSDHSPVWITNPIYDRADWRKPQNWAKAFGIPADIRGRLLSNSRHKCEFQGLRIGVMRDQYFWDETLRHQGFRLLKFRQKIKVHMYEDHNVDEKLSGSCG